MRKESYFNFKNQITDSTGGYVMILDIAYKTINKAKKKKMRTNLHLPQNKKNWFNLNFPLQYNTIFPVLKFTSRRCAPMLHHFSNHLILQTREVLFIYTYMYLYIRYYTYFKYAYTYKMKRNGNYYIISRIALA